VKKNTIQGVILFGSLAIIGIIIIQTYLVLTTWNLEEGKFHEKARIALLNVAVDLAELNDFPLPSQNLVNQLEPDYYVVNINNVIDANNLEYYLQKELEAVALSEDFEYGIYDCANQEMVYGKYINYPQKDSEKEKAKTDDLPTYDEFEYYFGVRFPTRTSYVLGNMRLTIVFSTILIITILFFLFSIFVILRQKLLSEMQKDFINNMTHEFKTPISTIRIASDVFLKDEKIKGDSRLSRYANIINDQNSRLNMQVEKVLQLAKIERDSFKLKPEPIDLHELIRETVASTEMKVQQLKGSLKLQLDALQAVVSADKLHLTNILHNLLDNAIKYHKGEPHITIRTKSEKGRLWLSIEDKGIGISKEHQSKVFNKFYRVPTGNVHNVKGFGLGLFYIRNICRAHGWKVSLNSELGEGTTITICMKQKG
jgi:two-component system phosphate regulon sensor histidine kinase PhoR